MVVGETMIVAGIGSRKGVAASEVIAAIDAALAACDLSRGKLDGLATISMKGGEAALSAASLSLGLPLIVVSDETLADVSGRTLTHSAISTANAGTPSVSEAAALAAAGPESRLLGPRLVVGSVTCAIAIGEGAP
jgi:cobalt-precorrin 5A hydrolase